MTTDPRALTLAKSRQQRAHNADGITARWDNLQPSEQRLLLAEAGAWLRAAVAAGIAPPAERPSPKHSAIWLDEEGFLYGEYQTSPPAPLADAAILRLVWESEECSSKREMEDRGAEFRLIGWSE
ncbi:hypothetical protein [Streptomyces sp. NPDC051997]|uniref:hypothetical protein n=1 Tax=Streptomyces sp. NPDC051997 TaxID=3155611 RepID=UPI0034247EDB